MPCPPNPIIIYYCLHYLKMKIKLHFFCSHLLITLASNLSLKSDLRLCRKSSHVSPQNTPLLS